MLGKTMDTSKFVVSDHGTATLATPYGLLLIDIQDIKILDRFCMLKYKKTSYGTYVIVWSSSKPRKRIGSLARLIMQATDGIEIDHINHNPMDNRKENLRVCTRQENVRNRRKRADSRQKYKGITLALPNCLLRPWRAIAKLNGKRISLGYYATEEEAASAYNAYASKVFGQFACVNELNKVVN